MCLDGIPRYLRVRSLAQVQGSQGLMPRSLCGVPGYPVWAYGFPSGIPVSLGGVPGSLGGTRVPSWGPRVPNGALMVPRWGQMVFR